jgi:hypothetical protein
MMRGREFLAVAQELAAGATEAHWRTAAGRAYYALMLEASTLLGHWGFGPSARENVHSFVRLRLLYATDRELNLVAQVLERLGRLRNMADYQIGSPGPFTSAWRAGEANREASAAIARLDRIESDPALRAAAIASIRP